MPLFANSNADDADAAVPTAGNDWYDADAAVTAPTGGTSEWNVSEPGTSSELTSENACASSTVGAEQVEVEVEVQVEVEVEVQVAQPVAMYVMLDRSMSMTTTVPGYPEELWEPSVAALSAFVQDTSNDGLSMALQYFPIAGGACGGAGYSTPAVAMGPIGDQRDALLTSLIDEDPNGRNTPTEGALRGATQYCEQYLSDHQGKCVVVLVTDGKPNGCEELKSRLVEVVDASRSAALQLYAVGLTGADFPLLDDLALAGGAEDCHPDDDSRYACDISDGAEQLNATLKKIQDFVTTTETRTETQTQTELQTRPLECEWRMPESDGETPVNPELVNVKADGSSVDMLALGRVEDVDACQARGWYYDDNDSPTRIKACPQTCEVLTGSGYEQVDILLGCATRLLLE